MNPLRLVLALALTTGCRNAVDDSAEPFDTSPVDTDVNEAPEATDDAVTTDEDAAISVAVLDNDSDPDGDDLVLTTVTQPANGTAEIDGSSVDYIPSADFHGSDSFTYTVADPEALESVATVMVTVEPVNDPPVALDDAATVDEDDAVVVAVTDNDTDVDGDALDVTATTSPAMGAVTVQTDGTLRYEPDADAHGSDSFDYTVADPSGAEDTATVTITVTPVDDAPVAVDDTASTDEDVPVSLDLVANDTDADGDALMVTSLGTTPDGTAIVESDGTVTFTPAPDFFGTATFSYTVFDGALEATGSVEVTVASVNDTPTGSDSTVIVDEDASAAFTADATDVEDAALDWTIDTPPGSGQLTGTGPDFTYTPDADYFGTDSAVLTATDDDGASVTLTITFDVVGVNDAPEADDQSLSLNQNADLDITLTATDVDGDTLTYTIDTPPTDGVLSGPPPDVTYTPDPGFYGSDSFVFRVADATESDTATVSLSVNPVDEYEAWILCYQSNGSDTVIRLVDYDDGSYNGTEVYQDVEPNDGFVRGKGLAVDEDFNAYFYTASASKLFRYDYGPPAAKNYERSVSSAFQQQGLAYADGIVYVRSNAAGGRVSLYDAVDGSFLRDVTNGVGTSSNNGGLLYSHTTNTLYWPVDGGGNIRLKALDVSTETVTTSGNLLPAPVSAMHLTGLSHTIDFEGNHYLVYYTDFDDRDKRLIKLDPSLNLLWQYDFNYNENRNTLVAIDLQRDVYLTEDLGSQVYVHKLVTDADGNNPVETWRTHVHTSGSNSPSIVALHVEKSPEGRVFTLHGVSGGLRSFRKSDGGGVKTTFNSGRCEDFVVLPGKPYAVP